MSNLNGWKKLWWVPVAGAVLFSAGKTLFNIGRDVEANTEHMQRLDRRFCHLEEALKVSDLDCIPLRGDP